MHMLQREKAINSNNFLKFSSKETKKAKTMEGDTYLSPEDSDISV